LAKMGPLENLNSFPPPSLSTIICVPTMSAGMRSGVNCILLNSNPRALLKDLTSSVLPSPGRPSIRTCPPQKKAISISFMSCVLPTTTRLISSRIESKSFLKTSTSSARPSIFSFSSTPNGYI